MRGRNLIILVTVAASAGMSLPPLQATAGDEVVISAFMAWEGEGQVVRTAADEATFVGSFAGTVYVNTESGPVEAGRWCARRWFVSNARPASRAVTANAG